MMLGRLCDETARTWITISDQCSRGVADLGNRLSEPAIHATWSVWLESQLPKWRFTLGDCKRSLGKRMALRPLHFPPDNLPVPIGAGTAICRVCCPYLACPDHRITSMNRTGIPNTRASPNAADAAEASVAAIDGGALHWRTTQRLQSHVLWQ